MDIKKISCLEPINVPSNYFLVDVDPERPLVSGLPSGSIVELEIPHYMQNGLVSMVAKVTNYYLPSLDVNCSIAYPIGINRSNPYLVYTDIDLIEHNTILSVLNSFPGLVKKLHQLNFNLQQAIIGTLYAKRKNLMWRENLVSIVDYLKMYIELSAQLEENKRGIIQFNQKANGGL